MDRQWAGLPSDIFTPESLDMSLVSYFSIAQFSGSGGNCMTNESSNVERGCSLDAWSLSDPVLASSPSGSHWWLFGSYLYTVVYIEIKELNKILIPPAEVVSTKHGKGSSSQRRATKSTQCLHAHLQMKADIKYKHSSQTELVNYTEKQHLKRIRGVLEILSASLNESQSSITRYPRTSDTHLECWARKRCYPSSRDITI
ncbi:hypothetical protein J6590_035857 [Homalodisca vitripennis]|nr:hypothetical protein J6590_035857 [Homalodisca vitripennis]